MTEYKKRMDMHTHTDNSPDGNHSTMYLCECAEQTGLRAIAFTDHCEVDAYYKDHYDRAAFQAYFEVVKARSVFRGRLIVAAGIELGQPAYDPALAEQILSKFDYDVVIGSLHNLRGRKDFYFMEYDGFTDSDLDAMVEEYLKELLTMVQWGGFDILAHLTYPLRYMVGENHRNIDLNRHSDLIDEILRQAARSGKALEINTSGLRQPLGETLPTLPYVRRFREFGGEYVTVGSDAHYAEDLGKGVNEGMKVAQEAGFSHVTLFQGRTPLPIPIE